MLKKLIFFELGTSYIITKTTIGKIFIFRQNLNFMNVYKKKL